jgi:hypothetical protein
MASRGALLLALLSMTCGDFNPPPFEAMRAIKTLAPEELATLCDWVANQFGGYDMKYRCRDGSTRSSHKSQADCVASLAGPSCQATVGDVQGCTDENLSCGPVARLAGNPACRRLIGCAK